tara:strand:- start:1289 stop:1450 length:162 start_codon:yes stop_codon:yes gene_type:complete
MNNNSNSRYKSIHLYNPKEEGRGSYDFHYINANKKCNHTRKEKTKKINERFAA